jgi:hypothetical protein
MTDSGNILGYLFAAAARAHSQAVFGAGGIFFCNPVAKLVTVRRITTAGRKAHHKEQGHGKKQRLFHSKSSLKCIKVFYLT